MSRGSNRLAEGVRVRIKYHGQLLSPTQLANTIGVSTQCIYNRLRSGVPHDQLIGAKKSAGRPKGPPPREPEPPVPAPVAQPLPPPTVTAAQRLSKIINFPKGYVPPPLVDLGKLVTPVRLAIAGAISSEQYLELEDRIYGDKKMEE